jgi:hypothetical protein
MTDPTPADPTPPPADPTPEAPAASEPAAAPAPAPAAAANTWAPPAAAPAGARPTGITILAVLAGIGGVLGLFGGFIVLFGGTILFGALGGLLGVAALAYAGLLVAFAYGAWTLKPWAWPLGVAVAAFGIIMSVIYVIGGSGIGNQILSVAIDVGILYYLNQPGIKALFGRA